MTPPLARVGRAPDPNRPTEDLFPGNVGLTPEQEVSFSWWLELYHVNLGAGAAVSYTPCGLKKRERPLRGKMEEK